MSDSGMFQKISLQKLSFFFNSHYDDIVTLLTFGYIIPTSIHTCLFNFKSILLYLGPNDFFIYLFFFRAYFCRFLSIFVPTTILSIIIISYVFTSIINIESFIKCYINPFLVQSILFLSPIKNSFF
jgi:hypothetical protein